MARKADPSAVSGSRRAQVGPAVLVVVIGFFMTFVSRGLGDSFMVFLVALENEFGWSRSSLAGVYSVYMLAAGVSAPLWGYYFDRFGPRATYASGLLILGAVMVLAGRSTQIWQLYVTAGVLSGVAGSALGMIPASNLISRWFNDRRASVIAVAHAGIGMGIVVVVPLAQMSIDASGWRSTYALMGLVPLALLPVVLVMPWRRLAAGTPSPDPGSGLVEIADPDAAGRGARSGFTMRQALATTEFWLLVQVFFFTAAGMYGVMVQTVPYLISAGLTPLQAATAFGSSAMLSIFGVIAAGVLSDIYGYRFTATVSFCGTLLGIIALLVFSSLPTAWLLLTYVLLFGLSQGARGPIVSALTSWIFAGSSFGTIYGAIFMLMSLGGAVGGFGGGLLHDLSGSYLPGFAVSMLCVSVACSAFWMSARLGNQSRGAVEPRR
ncbi:sugar phosphate permease [Mesorhizobium sp. J18]|uniref:MFS transporter n=1 Tax=Mesorhizobium sp. J18 TaxID=935263 RepID=UPI00119A3D7D|nr:MFS transporter [Mesorhizobium sp. J18]TWG96420.1 sugar phosphate permease [Mesorhizobium sp. J18]